MSTQLTVYQSYAFGDLLPEDVKTIHETIAKDCNESQFRLFMAVAKAADANPMLQEIHPSVYGGKLTWQFGIDYHIRKAKETPGFNGYDVQLVHEQDTFKMHQERAEDGRYFTVIDEHSWSFPRGKVVGGYALAYKEGFPPFSVLMETTEVEHYQKSQIGMQKTMWTNNFNDMFKKHMVKRAMKAAFGLRFDDGEDKEGGPGQQSYEPQGRKDITAEASHTEPTKQPEPELEKPDPKVEARAGIKSKLAQLGLTTIPTIDEFFATNKIKYKDSKNPTLAELQGVLQLLDQKIADKQAEEEEPLSVEE
jgi:recombination protein RecT